MDKSLDTREIRIFISSTFKDMQDERTYLFDYVFPRLRAIAERRSVKIIEIDLRWGVTYEESSRGKVLEICFNEIENCRPYFIGLLGNRYGWCPDQSELLKHVSTERSFPWVRDYINQGKSVTEMEMQFGALCSQLLPDQEIKASFFLKEDSLDIDEKQRNLKLQVLQGSSYPHYFYHSLEELGDCIEKEIMALLDKEYPEEKCHGLEKEISYQKAALKNLSFAVSPKRSIINKLESFLESDGRYMVVHGADHCGKSATLSHWIRTSPNLDGFITVPYFVGHSDSSTMESYENYVRGYLKMILSLEQNDEIDNLNFQAFTYRLSEDRRFLFLIDGVDQFEDGYIHPSAYLPRVHRGSKVIVSVRTENYLKTDCARVDDVDLLAWEHPDVLQDFDYYLEICKGKHWDNPLFKEYKGVSIKLSELSLNEVQMMVQAFLRRYGKKLTHNQLELISRDPKAKDVSLLRLFVRSLLYLTTPEELERNIAYFIGKKDSDELLQSFFLQYESLYGKGVFRDCMAYLIISRKGMPEKDLFQLLQVPQYVFSHLYHGIQPLLCDKSGYLTFAFERIPKAFIKYNQDMDLISYRSKLIDYYYSRNQYENVKVDRDSWLWKYDLPYQCETARQFEDLYRTILTPQVALADFKLLSWGSLVICGEIAGYWSVLLEQDCHRYSIDAYLKNPDLYLEYDRFSLVYLLGVHRGNNEYLSSVEFAERIVRIYQSHGQDYSDAVVVTYLTLASMHRDNNEIGLAESALIRALNLCRQVDGAVNIDRYLFTIWNELKTIYEGNMGVSNGFESQNDNELPAGMDPSAVSVITDFLDTHFRKNSEHVTLPDVAQCESLESGPKDDRMKTLCMMFYSMLSARAGDESIVRIYYDVITSYVNVCIKEADFTKALVMSEEALSISENYLGRNLDGWVLSDSNVAFWHYMCALMLKRLCRFEEAKDHVAEAIQLYSRGNESFLNADDMKQHCLALLNDLNCEQ